MPPPFLRKVNFKRGRFITSSVYAVPPFFRVSFLKAPRLFILMAQIERASPIHLGLQPKQQLAFESEATEILYGGAAGSGKSHLMRVAAIHWCVAIPGLNVYLFRRILPDLEKNHMEGSSGFRTLLAPWVNDGLCQIVEGEIRFTFNGSKIFLCHCRDENTVTQYQGSEMHVLMIDELTHFTEYQYRYLRSRVRMAGLKIPDSMANRFPRILCGSNPGGIGHRWVKNTWMPKNVAPFQVWRAEKEDGGMLRQYLPALLDDNQRLLDDTPNYANNLRGLGNPMLVDAMLRGNWDINAGAYFGDVFNPEKHMITPFEIPKTWLKFRSFDWGSSSPFSVGWYAVSDGTNVTNDKGEKMAYPEGAIINYRTWYGADDHGKGFALSPPQIAMGITVRSGMEEFAYSVADPSIFDGSKGPSIAEQMMRNGVVFREADRKRIPGWQEVRSRLRGDGTTPMLYFFNTCVDVPEYLPSAPADPNNMEDIDTDSDDHLVDQIRYAMMSRPSTILHKQPQNSDTLLQNYRPTLNELLKLGKTQKAYAPRI